MMRTIPVAPDRQQELQGNFSIATPSQQVLRRMDFATMDFVLGDNSRKSLSKMLQPMEEHYTGTGTGGLLIQIRWLN